MNKNKDIKITAFTNVLLITNKDLKEYFDKGKFNQQYQMFATLPKYVWNEEYNKVMLAEQYLSHSLHDFEPLQNFLLFDFESLDGFINDELSNIGVDNFLNEVKDFSIKSIYDKLKEIGNTKIENVFSPFTSLLYCLFELEVIGGGYTINGYDDPTITWYFKGLLEDSLNIKSPEIKK